MALIGLYSGRKIKELAKKRKRLTRTQTASQAKRAIEKKYKGGIVDSALYYHNGGGNWIRHSKKRDAQRTGKVTSDIKEWRKRPHKLDYKGVDTKGPTKATQKIKKYSIGKTWDSRGYKRKIVGYYGDGAYLVSDNKTGVFKRTGDIIKFSDIDSEISFDKKAFAGWKRTQEEISKADRKASEEKRDYEFTYGFADKLKPLQKDKVLKTLNKQQLYDGILRRRKDFIFEKVKSGYVVAARTWTRVYKKQIGERISGVKSGRVLEKGKSSYDGLTKIELDYAEYLIKKLNL